jgi:ADP-ribosylglycohydrolase
MSYLPFDHDMRVQNMILSLNGLSVGDSFGQSFFDSEYKVQNFIESHTLPKKPWFYTDDTIMSVSIVETLNKFGYISQDYLAHSFATKYMNEPNRGYGSTAQRILREIDAGISWCQAASSAFGGMGSMGNGAAMRSAPIGAYFFDDYPRVVIESISASAVTHSHPDAKAGAVAAAIAAAYCLRNRSLLQATPTGLLKQVIKMTPEGDTKSGLKRALNIPKEASISFAVSRLGNGIQLCSFDTVPIALWVAANYLYDFQEALWKAVSALGDRDTICAIVGGIVALSVGEKGIPQLWVNSRESLDLSL